MAAGMVARRSAGDSTHLLETTARRSAAHARIANRSTSAGHPNAPRGSALAHAADHTLGFIEGAQPAAELHTVYDAIGLLQNPSVLPDRADGHRCRHGHR